MKFSTAALTLTALLGSANAQPPGLTAINCDSNTRAGPKAVKLKQTYRNGINVVVTLTCRGDGVAYGSFSKVDGGELVGVMIGGDGDGRGDQLCGTFYHLEGKGTKYSTTCKGPGFNVKQTVKIVRGPSNDPTVTCVTNEADFRQAADDGDEVIAICPQTTISVTSLISLKSATQSVYCQGGNNDCVLDGSSYAHNKTTDYSDFALGIRGDCANVALSGITFQHFKQDSEDEGTLRAVLVQPGDNPPAGCESIRATFTDCQFLDNGEIEPVKLGGAAILVINSEVDLNNCLFANNTAKLGGAICVVSFNATKPDGIINISGCTFRDNYGGFGGAIAPGGKGGVVNFQAPENLFEGNRINPDVCTQKCGFHICIPANDTGELNGCRTNGVFIDPAWNGTDPISPPSACTL